MKQLIIFLGVGLIMVLGFMACTNDEGGEDLDIVTPNDSTRSKANQRKL
ncbi:hypothetical protein [Lentiprolixibacter aurantiacus]|uniref:Lipoprotein n=1 Tax=Lentiprolixibacter aurantiacus TaxID=2993939 RepID=A0AAE3MMM6_9FLAO|nr:hypothetical protein [Lentiprolixibacter aurantiacus]MCX2720640.1 hypothetical protein [Lentiprolixibacter aurantiacus]